jgi:hypothetical protein
MPGARVQTSVRLHAPQAAEGTVCGNTLNVALAMVPRVGLDSLRYRVKVMHIDGTFLTAIRKDPVLFSVKLIAEPWDVALDTSGAIAHFAARSARISGPSRDPLTDSPLPPHRSLRADTLLHRIRHRIRYTRSPANLLKSRPINAPYAGNENGPAHPLRRAAFSAW